MLDEYEVNSKVYIAIMDRAYEGDMVVELDEDKKHKIYKVYSTVNNMVIVREEGKSEQKCLTEYRVLRLLKQTE